jgi:small-conductance mechanosensitive channel
MKRFIPDPSEVIPAPDDDNDSKYQSTWLDTVALTIASLSVALLVFAILFGIPLLGYQTAHTLIVASAILIPTSLLYTIRAAFQKQ